MSGGVLYTLLAEGARNAAGTALLGLAPDSGGAGAGEFENWLPGCETRWERMFRQVTYTVSVIGTAGTAPTSWSLAARFEQRLAHTQGYQQQFPSWSPFSDEQLSQAILEGVGFYCPTSTVAGAASPPISGSTWGVIADSTATADDASGVLPTNLTTTTVPSSATTGAGSLITKRITTSRTVVNQLSGMRVRLQPTVVGGDSTTRIIVSAQALGVC